MLCRRNAAFLLALMDILDWPRAQMSDQTGDYEPEVETPEPGLIDAPPGYRFPKESTGLLPWARTLARLETARYYWLTTTRPDGRPHATPLWGVWVTNALFLD